MALDTTPLERPGNSPQDVLRSKRSFARSLTLSDRDTKSVGIQSRATRRPLRPLIVFARHGSVADRNKYRSYATRESRTRQSGRLLGRQLPLRFQVVVSWKFHGDDRPGSERFAQSGHVGSVGGDSLDSRSILRYTNL
jgi:hypothetical protein